MTSSKTHSEKREKPTIIGRVDKVYLLDYLRTAVSAKVDTGADLSSLWASNIKEKDGVLKFSLFGPSSPLYTGKRIVLNPEEYSKTHIKNSFGEREERYVAKFRVKINKRVIVGTFSLANRSRNTYPILIGRKLLHGKFIVDVKHGRHLDIKRKNKPNNDKLGA